MKLFGLSNCWSVIHTARTGSFMMVCVICLLWVMALFHAECCLFPFSRPVCLSKGKRQLHIFVSARDQIFDRVSDWIIGQHAAIAILVVVAHSLVVAHE